MASQATSTSQSRLAQMQMRFQQRQMQEREQRRIELTGGGGRIAGGGSASATALGTETTMKAKSVGNGKVRQMFDERRRGAGIDRSHPLKPIATLGPKGTSRNASGHNLTTSNSTVLRRNLTSKTIATPTAKTKRNEIMQHNDPFTNSDLDECDLLSNETFPKEFCSLSLNDDDRSDDYNNNSPNIKNTLNNNNNNNNKNNNKYSPNSNNSRESTANQTRVQSSQAIKLNPVVTKKSPSITKSRTTITPAARPPATPSGSMHRLKPALTKSTTSTRTAKVGVKSKSPVGKPAMSSLSIKPPPRIVTPPPGMATCRYCSRNFNEERLEKHEVICAKMANTKRRIFDASKHRVKGTEAEKYVKKPRGSTTSVVSKPTYISAAQISGAKVGVKKNNWRQKHEEFIAAIRAAKQLKAYLARGGKLSDLPPPPPSENPDYVQCPHCSRRFNEAAAERHIPKCATMLHNKPKPGSKPVLKKK